MSRVLVFAYGVLCYGIFFAVFLYLMAFNADMGVAKTVSSGTPGPIAIALLINLGLIALFGIQHTIMARPGFKAALSKLMPPTMERSTYVMATNVVLIILFAYWQPLPGQLWAVSDPQWAIAVHALSGIGWVLVLISTFLTDHFDLFGLRQVTLNLLGRTYSPVEFRENLFYRWIRHPMMLGILIAVWAIPVMTYSHLVFSLSMTLYIVIGIHFEERGLRASIGKPYQEYQARTKRVIPLIY